MKLKDIPNTAMLWCGNALVGVQANIVNKYGEKECSKVFGNIYDYEMSYEDLDEEDKKLVDEQIKEDEEDEKEYSN